MRTAYSQTYKLSRTFNAPLGFVYSWCTDFEGDDLRMIGSRNVRNIHEKTKRRVIWTVEGKKPPAGTDPVRVVWLRPPDSWHLETCGDGSEVGDYKLIPIGKDRTRLDMSFTETHADKRDVPSAESLKAEAEEHWKHYSRYLELDYGKSKPR